MDFDQIVAKYPGERYQAHLGLLFLFYIKTGQVSPFKRKLYFFVLGYSLTTDFTQITESAALSYKTSERSSHNWILTDSLSIEISNETVDIAGIYVIYLGALSVMQSCTFQIERITNAMFLMKATQSLAHRPHKSGLVRIGLD